MSEYWPDVRARAFSARNQFLTMDPDMKYLNERLNTFENGGWVPSPLLPLPVPSASAGFFYVGHGDVIKCFECGGELMCLDKKMCPYVAHLTYFPHCEFMKKEERKEKDLCDPTDCKCPKESPEVISDVPLVDDLEAWSKEETKEKFEKMVERIECVICKVKRREIIFLSCMHLCVCRSCSHKIDRECPICRTTITDRRLVFFS